MFFYVTYVVIQYIYGSFKKFSIKIIMLFYIDTLSSISLSHNFFYIAKPCHIVILLFHKNTILCNSIKYNNNATLYNILQGMSLKAIT